MTVEPSTDSTLYTRLVTPFVALLLEHRMVGTDHEGRPICKCEKVWPDSYDEWRRHVAEHLAALAVEQAEQVVQPAENEIRRFAAYMRDECGAGDAGILLEQAADKVRDVIAALGKGKRG